MVVMGPHNVLSTRGACNAHTHTHTARSTYINEQPALWVLHGGSLAHDHGDEEATIRGL